MARPKKDKSVAETLQSAARRDERKQISNAKYYNRRRQAALTQGRKKVGQTTKGVVKRNGSAVPTLLDDFVDKIMKMKSKTMPFNYNKWQAHFNKHLHVSVYCHFPVKLGEDGVEIDFCKKNEIKNDRRYVISFHKEDNRRTGGIETTDLFEVKKSQIPGAGHGLFALQPFKQGAIIGVYFGTKIDPTSTVATEYSMKSDTLKCTLDAKGGVETKHPKYFGLQFANDPFLGDKKMMTRQNDRTYAHNIFIDDTYIARATVDIQVGQELFLYYGWHEGDDDADIACTCHGCETRRRVFCMDVGDM